MAPRKCPDDELVGVGYREDDDAGARERQAEPQQRTRVPRVEAQAQRFRGQDDEQDPDTSAPVSRPIARLIAPNPVTAKVTDTAAPSQLLA